MLPPTAPGPGGSRCVRETAVFAATQPTAAITAADGPVARQRQQHQVVPRPEAQQWFDRAVKRIEALQAKGSAEPPLSWSERLELRLLRREAETLLKNNKP